MCTLGLFPPISAHTHSQQYISKVSSNYSARVVCYTQTSVSLMRISSKPKPLFMQFAHISYICGTISNIKAIENAFEYLKPITDYYVFMFVWRLFVFPLSLLLLLLILCNQTHRLPRIWFTFQKSLIVSIDSTSLFKLCFLDANGFSANSFHIAVTSFDSLFFHFNGNASTQFGIKNEWSNSFGVAEWMHETWY